LKKIEEKKEMNKDIPCSLVKYFQVLRKRYVSRSIVELG
jgi:hypothetical protein